MAFALPRYTPPAFNSQFLETAPLAVFERVEQSGVAPEGYHATSIFPEYLHMNQGEWRLVEESRMDCVITLEADGSLAVKEFRHLKVGDSVARGRRENGEDGIYVHTGGFELPSGICEKFAFRTQVSRETSFSIDYDELYELLDHERENGFILWVLGPAVAFDKDARDSFTEIIDSGYVHGLLAGNALAVHDMEGSIFGTALGQELYSKTHAVMGHYKHLDTINKIRSIGSIGEAVSSGLISDGIMKATIQKRIPYVLAGSIRDDGPLPAVIADVYQAQDEMRALARRATTVVAMATQLHAIATGNMIPSYRVVGGQQVRPVYFYSVDMSEFATNKLANRGSLTARTILTNVQDFVVNLERGLLKKCRPNAG
jgi:lysine-ketoglutarate reductase/saccharopine dehydrogenase-like protein (TIGR00300 family)